MSEKSNEMGGVGAGVRSVFFGASDPRLRATWRFLLAWPLLPVVGALVALVAPLLGLRGMIPGGPLQVAVFLVLLVPWARYVDRRPLSGYGVSASRSWGAQLFVGILVTVAVWTGWYALASSLGWVQVEMSMTAPQDSLTFGLVGTFVSVLLNTWVQDVVFFAIVVASAAEGFRSRGLAPARAVLGAWLVGVLFFTAIHGTPTVADAAGTAVGGAVFGLLYVHTGELALTIGTHWGASYAAGTVFAGQASPGTAVFTVSRSLPGALDGWGSVVLYLGTYLLLVGWLVCFHGGVPLETDLARWTNRRQEPAGISPSQDGG